VSKIISQHNKETKKSFALSKDTKNKLIDLRKTKGRLWFKENPVAMPSLQEDDKDIDAFIYQGYRQGGAVFLRSVHGRYGAVYQDNENGVIFLCRDWIGEVPLHYYLTDDSIIVANCISDIQTYLGDEEWHYEFVRVVPQAHALVFDTKEQYIFGRHIRNIWTIIDRLLYYDFAKISIESSNHATEQILPKSIDAIYLSLKASIEQRFAAHDKDRPIAMLLSGGIDSLTVAYFLSKLAPNAIAYTLSVGENGGHDAVRAREIASHFGMQSRTIRVTANNLVSLYTDAVRVSELYHMPNVYCALGMLLLGKALKADGIKTAFCGEGVNEALGDYHDWVIRDPVTHEERLLQRVDDRQLSQTKGRIRYVWGRTHQEGRFNLQLGSGLAKHGVGRMIKPFLNPGIELECPYFDPELMRWLVSISQSSLETLGGKPGLMAKVFASEIKSGEIPEHFILDSQKIRLQDSSELGEGGITPILLGAGLDQEETISIFNRLFGAHLLPKFDANRLSLCAS
jgi:asparagine synthetase B (glutamine-hydrolysing)